MDQCTKEVRMQNRKNIISECQARPEGQTAKQWMDEHKICEQTYYVWQRRIRQAAYNDMTTYQAALPVASSKAEVTFAEISMQQLPGSKEEVDASAVAVLKTDTYAIEINENICI
ncbi:MAG: IS66 family insertion sequence element accessory protein TnpB [Lachnospiraceae bacterium]|nr:IS66 family insertion sequence element accessory protein TnpB [Lachnospiraceae bacterium]